MKAEHKKQFKVIGKVLIVVLCASLYGFGGVQHKWLRRFLVPSICCGAMYFFTRNWKSIIQLPFMFVSLSMGYGAETLIWKIFRRGLFGLANGVSSSGYNLIKKKFLLAGFQTALLVGAYIVFGVWNPLPSARAEETILGLFVFAVPLLSAEGKK